MAAGNTRAGMFDALRSRITGDVILPDDPGYDDARKIFNAMIDRRPAVIVSVAGTDDVAEAVNFARQTGLMLSVRGGGHGVAGNCIRDNGLMVDLSKMKGIDVDPVGRVVTAEGGVKLGELITATEKYGLVTPTGTASDTGMAGLTLGAGFGYICAKFGLAVDNLVGAEVVTADGQVLHVSETEHPDLFWALRGGSGNFGVVTKFELKLYPLEQMLAGFILHPFPRAREVLRMYRDAAASAPDELIIYAAMLTGPDGNKAVGLLPCWCGSMEEGERVLAPLRAFGPPIVDMVRPMPYSELNTQVDQAAPPGLRDYWKQSLLRNLSDDAINALISAFENVPSPRTVVLIDHVHGAAHRVASTATAFPHRDANHSLLMLSMWTEPEDDERNIAWTRELAASVHPYSTGGVYVNEPLDEKASSAFGANLDRLIEIKQRYDPTNMFQSNLNFAPAAGAR
jgi:FAD/FMN-containing dehydrogenase